MYYVDVWNVIDIVIQIKHIIDHNNEIVAKEAYYDIIQYKNIGKPITINCNDIMKHFYYISQ